MSNLIVSKSFDRLAEEFKQHDQQAGKSFVAMLNTQEAAKAEYQESTGKVHGFNDAWADAVGISKKTVEEYNRIAKLSVEFRKSAAAVGFSGLSSVVLKEYAASPDEIREAIQELVEDGGAPTPLDIRQMREHVVIDSEKSPKYVYVITNPAFKGWVKIGMAGDVNKRIADLNTASPYPYRAEFSSEMPAGLRDLSIHDYAEAKASSKSLEWFQMDTQEAIDLVASLIAVAKKAA